MESEENLIRETKNLEQDISVESGFYGMAGLLLELIKVFEIWNPKKIYL